VPSRALRRPRRAGCWRSLRSRSRSLPGRGGASRAPPPSPRYCVRAGR